jgi:hypothetical protein
MGDFADAGHGSSPQTLVGLTLAPADKAPPASGLRRVLLRVVQAVPPLRRLWEARRLRRRMRAALGYDPDLRRPQTFNEKVAWRILYDRNPLIALTTDKLAVRRYVAAKVSPDILVPLLGTWDRAEDIDWNALPSRFVLKASHGWSMNLLVHDKAAIDRESALATAAGWLRHSHAAATGEWGYRNIQPRLLAETMLLDEFGEIPADLKFYVFNGRMQLLRVHTGRFDNHRITFFDRAMQPLPVNQIYAADPDWLPPPEINEAAGLAERLGADFDFARVDLYVARGRIWFGEITHYDGNATVAYVPRSYDRIIGDMWRLPGSAVKQT